MFDQSGEKRFIMFDQSGDKGRIMIEPNRFYEIPSIFMPGNAILPDQLGNHSNLNKTNSSNFQHIYYREAMASFSALQSMRESRLYSRTICDLRDIPGALNNNSNENKESDCTSRLSWDGSNVKGAEEDDEATSSMHEDSEDIDALLYSDEEEDVDEECCSTGHSPSEVTSCDEEGESSGGEYEISSAFTGGEDATGNVEIGLVNVEFESSKFNCGLNNNDSGSPKRPRRNNNNNKGKAIASHLVVTRKMKKNRKDKIRQTVKMLQSIIPGGDSMDAAVVLDEAIQYMRVLQMKVLELEASRQVKL